jgi:hypothetical protein
MGLERQVEGIDYIFFEDSWNVPACPPSEQGEQNEKSKR